MVEPPGRPVVPRLPAKSRLTGSGKYFVYKYSLSFGWIELLHKNDVITMPLDEQEQDGQDGANEL